MLLFLKATANVIDRAVQLFVYTFCDKVANRHYYQKDYRQDRVWKILAYFNKCFIVDIIFCDENADCPKTHSRDAEAYPDEALNRILNSDGGENHALRGCELSKKRVLIK